MAAITRITLNILAKFAVLHFVRIGTLGFVDLMEMMQMRTFAGMKHSIALKRFPFLIVPLEKQ